VSRTRRQKAIIAALTLYWPAMFIATHIPTIPRWVGPVPFSDKILHFAAYFLLSFLLWYAISPTRRVSWRKPAVWIMLAIIVWYGAFDEWLQGYVGRSPDMMDFAANLCGAITGFIILSIINFWPAALAAGAGGILIMTYFFRANPETTPVVNKIIFSIFGYGFYTAIWLRYIHYYLPVKCPQGKWWFAALILPLGILSVIEVFCALAGHNFNGTSFATSLITVLVLTLAGYLYEILSAKIKRNALIT